jgi:hypothetical protein
MNVQEYRRRAQRYLVLARHMTDLANRAAMVDLAAIWMRLAEQSELNERFVQECEQMLAVPKQATSPLGME